MATVGSHKTTLQLGSGGEAYVSLHWLMASYDPAARTSTVTWELKLGVNDRASSIVNREEAYQVVINGQTFSGTANTKIGVSSTKTLASGSVVVQHDNKGSAKTISYSYSQVLAVWGTAQGSSTASLSAIATPGLIETAPNFTDVDNPTITYFAGRGVQTLQACIANSTGNTVYVAYRDIPKDDTSYTFTLTDAERTTLRNAAASSASLSLRFYVKSTVPQTDGTTYTGYSFLSRTFSVGDAVPTVNPVVKDTNSTTLALTGNESVLIPGYSNAYYSIGATAQKGASIQTQSVTCGAIVKSTATGTFTAVPNYEFTFYCRDTRGNYIYQPYEADYIPYFKVTCNQTVHLNLDGTVRLVVTGKYFNSSFGAKNNELKIEARSRETGGSWSSWGDISVLLADASNDTYTLTATMSGFDPSGTYEFQARATDKLTTATSSADSVTLKPIFDWSKYDFNFNVPVTIEGAPLEDYVIETGTEAMGTNGTWYWSKWKSGKAECYGCRNYGNMAVTTAWGGLYRSGAFTQSLPSGLFADTPEVIDISFRGGSNVGGWIANHENSAPDSSTTGSFILVRPASATLTGSYISFNVIGRWK